MSRSWVYTAAFPIALKEVHSLYEAGNNRALLGWRAPVLLVSLGQK
jgi:hypothetical protein